MLARRDVRARRFASVERGTRLRRSEAIPIRRTRRARSGTQRIARIEGAQLRAVGAVSTHTRRIRMTDRRHCSKDPPKLLDCRLGAAERHTAAARRASGRTRAHASP
ncbi:hypothetical protein, partial [Burkholderia dolosa]|uniref:hypothetical protein n=1 Tax=Burkholderia dolosa TaxID=152500 RepID=UPI001C2E62DD